jgi:carnitine 3-dehydrogenase
VSERVIAPSAVQRVACIGAGVIGGGWVAHFLARGYQVVAWDPAPDAAEKLRQLVDAAWPALTELGLAEGATRENLTVAPTLEAAVADAEFVQESAPEKLELKQELLARIDAATAPDVVIASSTSGYGMTEMQVHAARPQRLVVGHPFNPPYLIPLVEVVGGAGTERWAVDWATEFYEVTGKSVITMESEVPGFIANRLQEAIWREALHMVANGEATVEQIDTSITEGPGLRWPLFGPCLTFHLAGGAGGMKHMLDHFGPSLQAPWTRLQAPELTDELRDRMVKGCADAAAGRSVPELVAQRDRALIAVMRAIDDVRGNGSPPTDAGVGGVVTPYERTPRREWDESADIPAPLWLHQTPVDPAWVDYNGHMSESCYLRVFGDNSDAFFRYIGIDEQHRAEGYSLYTVETHLHHRREVAQGELLRLSLRVLDQDAKRVHVFHEMYHGTSDTLLATAEQMLLHVDMTRGSACAMPEVLQRRLAAIRQAHAALPSIDAVSRPMGISRRAS